MPRRDADIDRLFQVAPEEFTAARNALAKEAGSDGAAIRRLQKPPLPAWAVNQLFWKSRDVYDALVNSAEALRHAHKAVLTGGHGDIRAASKAHDEALESALKETLSLVADSGHKATDATKQAILNTLRALPADETPGHLTRILQPGGFEMLTGITPRPPKAERPSSRPTGLDRDGVRAGRGGAAPVPRSKPSARAAGTSAPEKPQVDPRAVARAKELVARTTREARGAEQAARREEFETARTAREAVKAASRLQAARDALAAAERDVDEAQRELAAAEKERDATERRAKESDAELAAVRERARAAQAALDALRRPDSRRR